LYDRALGPTEFAVLCPTCGLTTQECPGHAGHIELSVPVLNVLFFPTLFRLLRLKCFACHRLRIPASRSRVLKVKLMLLDCGRLEDALALDMRLAARPSAAAELSAGGAGGSQRKRGADADEPEDVIDAELARQAALLRDLEIECVAARGIDVGCGFDPDSATASSQFSQTVRAYRAGAIADFLANVPPKTCANCSAATVAVSKNGYSKIFRKRLGAAAAARMEALGIKYQDATNVLRMRAERGAGSVAGTGVRASAGVGASDDEDGAAPGGGGDDRDGDGEPVTQHLMPVSEIAAHMQLLWETEAGLLRRAFFPVRTGGGARARALLAEPTDGWKALFLRVLPVPPSRFRPPTRLGESSFEHPQNVYYSKIIKLSDRMLELSAASERADAGGVDMAALMSTWIALQDAVNGLLDASKAPTTNGKEPPNGVRQLLEKKEGLFRQNMMGKRVNYAARTVISPDPYLRVDQVGVPLHFATSLHFKQGVTTWNYAALAAAVRNGPHKWPGATHIEYEGGRVVDLSKVSQSQRDSFARTLLVTAGSDALSSGAGGGHAALMQPSDADVGAAAAAAASGGLLGVGVKRVWRHMIDGDIVLMNRQVRGRASTP
jgi:DNA-directed RNA polymerase I subunit RPA1